MYTGPGKFIQQKLLAAFLLASFVQYFCSDKIVKLKPASRAAAPPPQQPANMKNIPKPLGHNSLDDSKLYSCGSRNTNWPKLTL